MIRVESAHGICTIRMDRPEKKNALTSAMYDAFADALDEADASPHIRVCLITGVPGAFSAGNDIADFLKVAETGEGPGTAVIRFLKALAGARKPLVAAVDGLAIGVGTTMLFHCDMIFVTPRSVFRTPFLDLGLVPEAASTLLAPRMMGTQKAFELLCLGAPFDAEAAYAAGFVNYIVDEGSLDASALQCCHAIAAKPPAALVAARELIRGDRADILARIDAEALVFRDRLASDEARAALHSFMNKGKA